MAARNEHALPVDFESCIFATDSIRRRRRARARKEQFAGVKKRRAVRHKLLENGTHRNGDVTLDAEASYDAAMSMIKAFTGTDQEAPPSTANVVNIKLWIRDQLKALLQKERDKARSSPNPCAVPQELVQPAQAALLGLNALLGKFT